MKNMIHAIKRKIVHIGIRPITIYCLHHVCEQFDSESMHEGDWMALDVFKQKVLAMQQSGVQFISLTEAYNMLKASSTLYTLHSTLFRRRKYAVLTFDDGYASLKEVLPWLKEQGIPVTLFVNPDYAAGKAYRETEKESYLTIDDYTLFTTHYPLHTTHYPLIEIGMHGAQHLDVSRMSEAEFRAFADESIAKTMSLASRLSPLAYIPFWAYTWGRHTEMTDKVLAENGVVPVYIDGMKNYNDATCIHRELL